MISTLSKVSKIIRTVSLWVRHYTTHSFFNYGLTWVWSDKFTRLVNGNCQLSSHKHIKLTATLNIWNETKTSYTEKYLANNLR